jgi:sulfur carrier protein ThiS
MNTKASIKLEVIVPKSKGSQSHIIKLNGEDLHLSDLFVQILNTKWGNEFILVLENGTHKVKPGYLMVLNGTMVQSWQVSDTVIKDGQQFKLVRVVPGG